MGGAGKLPVSATLGRRLEAALRDPALGSNVAAVVVDAADGTTLFARNHGSPLTPASTTKVVTAVAALASLGPDARLSTRVVRGQTKDSVILVGGGDPTLAGPRAYDVYPKPALLSALAQRTAQALKAQKITKVRLGYDDSLFLGSRTAASWKPGYVPEGSVAPITALEIDGGRLHPNGHARSTDPPALATSAFASLLTKEGISVVRGQRVKAAPKAAELARVDSPPVYALVERMLTLSDNDLAEALARHIAINEGKPASFDGGAQAVKAVLSGLEVATGVEVYDGSGLSVKNRLTPMALAKMLAVAAGPEHTYLRGAISGLPVAGFTGTLADRYGAGPNRVGAGAVRAKTGTLNGVSTLAGVTRTADGRMLAFAFLADRVPGVPRAQVALDRLASIVATCGCS
ncbi:D-alanyl-D-alanine carboxypeptidase/D-alanyl-D-alanine endopeptidase [Rhizohabitans arisaemae]|uniref:D-alanyl-D-alanine carboxypeptidase/D-alanyl-D-alanine endopeptidase n=1 Tax=Rhizohabitans arisaemae TaxID=2720610 RepID=UPI0024B2840F|nr:D-alanyl-D-alanine carboxypeptidase/D-alanyl-D-alanine-endopeptidase [Rhizohabitans arisaemae]